MKKDHEKSLTPATLQGMLGTLDLPVDTALLQAYPQHLKQQTGGYVDICEREGLAPNQRNHLVIWLRSLTDSARTASLETAVGRLRSPELILYIAHVLGRDVVEQAALKRATEEAVATASVAKADEDPRFRVRAASTLKRAYRTLSGRALAADIQDGFLRLIQAAA